MSIITIGGYLYGRKNRSYQPSTDKNKVMNTQQNTEVHQNKQVERKNANSDAFYQAIIDNNIFRPLGWQPETPQPKYVLIGTAIATNTTQHTKAYIVERQSGQLHVVRVNDRIGEQMVKGIEAKQVILQKGDQEIILQIEHSPFF
ncbi:hypothetical protein C6501_10055 [Candidatus Poribacteria bacterium]|nr:MAG: hypothetical protein C6501_10055 [Candidatus Poribacteria bacterium]